VILIFVHNATLPALILSDVYVPPNIGGVGAGVGVRVGVGVGLPVAVGVGVDV
jgi:hypothetical protein